MRKQIAGVTGLNEAISRIVMKHPEGLQHSEIIDHLEIDGFSAKDTADMALLVSSALWRMRNMIYRVRDRFYPCHHD